ncbi:bifunctional diaminohydroxyphosphoribosylaminopyrimidine deaminase/5-amino-6-(5-phosphoribosylamino)uracil reductase RibD [Candidatus Micrarchaeota archaeon]|nr:bifunctional diaminohydroxyphosphoribosylaminopyrimidine deaminase/5-amino-6-(5-phosphoribosylamino)uracil reductase RibD [Candidatus Micrarchaeota archaeon]
MQVEGEKFMLRALKLARKFNPSPNPRVGAVVVKDGEIVGEGAHEFFGGPHAEINALKQAGELARGATLFVSLEPCSHSSKKTPPCVPAIIQAGIKKVVCAVKDANPSVNGESELKQAGILVEFGVCETGAVRLNEKFFKFVSTRLPFVTLKCAESLDGKTSCNSGDSKWITCEKSRAFARKLRAEHDAVLVGVETILKDDPQLTVRIKNKKNPTRVVLDSCLRVPLDAKVFEEGKVVIATTPRHDSEKKKQLEEKGVNVVVCKENEDGKVDVRDLLKRLGELEVSSVLVEGGSEVNASFIQALAVDTFVFFIAPKLIGGRNAKSAVGGNGIDKMSEAKELEITRVKRMGSDLLVEAVAKK